MDRPPAWANDAGLVEGKCGDYKFLINERVETRQFGGRLVESWLPGRVENCIGDELYDVRYENGRLERKVRAGLLRACGEWRDDAEEEKTGNDFAVGSRVLARYTGKHRWFSGTVSKVDWTKEESNFDVEFDDGDFEARVPSTFLRHLEESPLERVCESPRVDSIAKCFRQTSQFQQDQRVLTWDDDADVWRPGKIARIYLDSTYDVNLEDGRTASGIPETSIRNYAENSLSAEPESSEQGSFEIDQAVRAQYGKTILWAKGKVTRVNTDASYNIEFEDGTRQLSVPANKIEPYTSKPQAWDQSHQFACNEIVRVRRPYRSTEQDAQIVALLSDGSYEVVYLEDGHRESQVDSLRVKPSNDSEPRSPEQKEEEEEEEEDDESVNGSRDGRALLESKVAEIRERDKVEADLASAQARLDAVTASISDREGGVEETIEGKLAEGKEDESHLHSSVVGIVDELLNTRAALDLEREKLHEAEKAMSELREKCFYLERERRTLQDKCALIKEKDSRACEIRAEMQRVSAEKSALSLQVEQLRAQLEMQSVKNRQRSEYLEEQLLRKDREHLEQCAQLQNEAKTVQSRLQGELDRLLGFVEERRRCERDAIERLRGRGAYPLPSKEQEEEDGRTVSLNKATPTSQVAGEEKLVRKAEQAGFVEEERKEQERKETPSRDSSNDPLSTVNIASLLEPILVGDDGRFLKNPSSTAEACTRRNDIGNAQDSPGGPRLRFQVGEAVLARYQGGRRFHPGCIRKVRKDGTYHVHFELGGSERHLASSHIRKANFYQPPSQDEAEDDAVGDDDEMQNWNRELLQTFFVQKPTVPKFSQGEVVDARVDRLWKKGKVESLKVAEVDVDGAKPTGTWLYSIRFSDGSFTEDMHARNIRSLGGGKRLRESGQGTTAPTQLSGKEKEEARCNALREVLERWKECGASGALDARDKFFLESLVDNIRAQLIEGAKADSPHKLTVATPELASAQRKQLEPTGPSPRNETRRQDSPSGRLNHGSSTSSNSETRRQESPRGKIHRGRSKSPSNVRDAVRSQLEALVVKPEKIRLGNAPASPTSDRAKRRELRRAERAELESGHVIDNGRDSHGLSTRVTVSFASKCEPRRWESFDVALHESIMPGSRRALPDGTIIHVSLSVIQGSTALEVLPSTLGEFGEPCDALVWSHKHERASLTFIYLPRSKKHPVRGCVTLRLGGEGGAILITIPFCQAVEVPVPGLSKSKREEKEPVSSDSSSDDENDILGAPVSQVSRSLPAHVHLIHSFEDLPAVDTLETAYKSCGIRVTRSSRGPLSQSPDKEIARELAGGASRFFLLLSKVAEADKELLGIVKDLFDKHPDLRDRLSLGVIDPSLAVALEKMESLGKGKSEESRLHKLLHEKAFLGAVCWIDEVAVRELRLGPDPMLPAFAPLRGAQSCLELVANVGSKRVPPVLVLIPRSIVDNAPTFGAAGRRADIWAALLNLGQDLRRSKQSKYKLVFLCQGEDKTRPCSSCNGSTTSPSWCALDIKLSSESLAKLLPAHYLGLRALRASFQLGKAHRSTGPLPCPSTFPGLESLVGEDALRLLEAAFFEHPVEKKYREQQTSTSGDMAQRQSATGPDFCSIIGKALDEASLATSKADGKDFAFANAINRLNYALNDSANALHKLLGRDFDFKGKANLLPVTRLANGQIHWACQEHAKDRRYSVNSNDLKNGRGMPP